MNRPCFTIIIIIHFNYKYLKNIRIKMYFTIKIELHNFVLEKKGICLFILLQILDGFGWKYLRIRRENTEFNKDEFSY